MYNVSDMRKKDAVSKHVKLAVLQMDATPAPTDIRLNRATQLVESATRAGAQLVILPELFNTGYTYEDTNYAVAETMTGTTVQWLRKTAE
ncbi:MAG: hypothetical protein CUN57_03495 [Phototrophicales bacterium]|nr:MAG: hypothetical protein CUN57_03495 [Phototrophicales bacterium]